MHKSKKEEYTNAIQNVGAVLFFLGILGGCMAGNEIMLIVCFAVACIGVLLIYATEYIMDKLEQKEEQKNKGPHRQAHDLYN